MGVVQFLQGDRWLKHPAHPMFVAFPIGMWTLGMILDGVASATKNKCAQDAANYAVTGGLIGAGLSAVTGLSEYQRVPKETSAQNDAVIHGSLNATATVLNGISVGMRTARKGQGSPIGWLPKILTLASVGIVGYTGWLGGMLTYDHGVGVALKHAEKMPWRREDEERIVRDRGLEEERVSME